MNITNKVRWKLAFAIWAAVTAGASFSLAELLLPHLAQFCSQLDSGTNFVVIEVARVLIMVLFALACMVCSAYVAGRFAFFPKEIVQPRAFGSLAGRAFELGEQERERLIREEKESQPNK